jgi:hypothetical protein
MRMPWSLVRRVRELPSTVADGLLAALLTLLALPQLFLDSEYFERLDIPAAARAGRWPRSGAGSPASCTTWSPTRSA